jgi:protein-tyrosine phosphatase
VTVIKEYENANLLELNNKLEINHYLINERDYDINLILEAVDKLQELLSNNKKVLIHCSYGRNRSPAIILF